ncbi:MAG: MFS transporter [Spirochaetes bacterium]|nr:MFS transporter [Spirochaetota bacterium]
MNSTSIERNIPKNYPYTFLSGTRLSEAIWMLYLAFRGMSLVQIGLIESVFHVTSLLMEVPTGIIADRFGRRTSRLLGRLMAMLGTLLMVVSGSFWGFAVAFVFTALSFNLESGAGDALVYDSLVQCGKQDRYTRVKGRQEVAWQAAQIVSLVVGGIIATFDYTLAYLLTLGIEAVSLVVCLTFEEPRIGATNPKGQRPGFVRHVTGSFRVLHENRGILVYILFIEGFGIFCTTLHFYFQNFLKSRGYVEWQIGTVLALSSLAGMLGAALAHRLEKRLGKRLLVSLSPFVALAAFALIAFTGLEIPAMILRAAVEGILYVSFSDSINRLIPSEHRATLLSFESMSFSVMMIFLFPVIGAVADRMGFKIAFTVIFAAAVPLLLLSRWLLLRTMRSEPMPPAS